MANSSAPPIYSLATELYYQIANYLNNDNKYDVLSLLKVSRRFKPVAEAVLYPKIAVYGGEDTDAWSNMPLFLRTMLDRPDLARKVKSLAFGTMCMNVSDTDLDHFEENNLREMCLEKILNMGYTKGHPWYQMVVSSFESALGGLLLSVLPNLVQLKLTIFDGQLVPTPYSNDPLYGLFGTYQPPAAALACFQNITHLIIPGGHLQLLPLGFPNLVHLDIYKAHEFDLRRIHGPGSLRSGFNLRSLSIHIPWEIVDPDFHESFRVRLADLFKALGCKVLRKLELVLCRKSPHEETLVTPDYAWLTEDLQVLAGSLEELAVRAVRLEPELTFPSFQGNPPINSLREFAALRKLVITQDILQDIDESMIDLALFLPPNLRELEIDTPRENIDQWFEHLWAEKEQFPHLRLVQLACWNDLMPPDQRSAQEFPQSSYFRQSEDSVWSKLQDVGITVQVVRRPTGQTRIFSQKRAQAERFDELEDGHDDIPQWTQVFDLESNA